MCLWWFRALAHKLGFSARGVGSALVVASFFRTVWENKAGALRFPEQTGSGYDKLPILGTIGIVRDVLKHGGGYVQMKVAGARNVGLFVIVCRVLKCCELWNIIMSSYGFVCHGFLTSV
jgi:hypothetical protein